MIIAKKNATSIGLLTFLFVSIAPPLYAQGGFYGGASLGLADVNDACNIRFFSGTCENRDTAGKLFGGLRITPNIAVEGSYVDLGEFASRGTLSGGTEVSEDFELSGFNVSGVAYWPVAPQVDIFGKAGIFLWELESLQTENGVETPYKDDGASLSLGAGAQYYLGQHLGLRAEWEHFHNIADDSNNESNVNMFSIGVTYSTL